ncbi:MAG: L-threonylcarbamoyladenylate synthase [Bacilli bacterium]
MNKCNIKDINLIKSYTNNNKIIVIPTDTIYGVGCNIKSYKKIIELKKRKLKPLAIVCHNFETMCKIIEIPLKYYSVLNKLLPGDITIVGKTKNSKYSINKGYITTGVRIPNHPSLLDALKETGPLVLSSANISGQSETYDIKTANQIFGNGVDLYVENDQQLSKTASTVINIDTLEIYRKGHNWEEILFALKSL